MLGGLALSGCQQWNPEFAGGDGDTGTDAADLGDDGETTTDDGGTSAGTTDDGTSTGPDPDDTSDTESTDDADTDPDDTTDVDTGPPVCDIEVFDTLNPRFGDPWWFEGQTCPGEIGRFVKVHQVAGSGWMAWLCGDGCGEGCYDNQQESHPISADPFALNSYVPAQIDLQNADVGCYFVEAEGLIAEVEDSCIYSAMTIFDHNGPEGGELLFATARDDAPATWSASNYFQGWQHPTLLFDNECPCAAVDGIECCEDEGLTAHKFSVDNAVIYPPNNANVTLADHPVVFHALQAHEGQVCGAPKQISWAITAGG